MGAIVGQRAPQGARAWQTEKTVTTCSYCADGCRLVLHSYQDRVVRVASEVGKGLNGGNLCVKGRFGLGYADSPDRLTTPLVRNAKGELRRPPGTRRLRWSRTGSPRRKKAKGGQAVGCHLRHPRHQRGRLSAAEAHARRGGLQQRRRHRPCGAGCLREGALAAAFGLARRPTRARTLAQADVILVVGANLTESHPVLALEVIKALREGKTVIVIDPRTTELAGKAALSPGREAGHRPGGACGR